MEEHQNFSTSTLPDLVELFFEELNKNELNNAERISAFLTERFGDHYAAWNIRAIALRLTNRSSDALSAIVRSMQLHTTPDSLEELIRIYQSLGLYDEADQLSKDIANAQKLKQSLPIQFPSKQEFSGYKYVYFEISGICNGKCPYCVTGINCIIGRNIEDIKARKFVDVDEFEFTITRLIQNSLIDPSISYVQFYNWGEPMLHPHFEKILSIATEKGLHYGLSTNCSVLKELSPYVLTNMINIIFSMSGFSQESYNRIHGFNFEKVKHNITQMVHLWRKMGYKGGFTINFHVYQFNISEMRLAAKFAKVLGIGISFVHATLNGFNLMKSYFEDTMSRDILKKCGSELITYFYEDIKRPESYRCSQFDNLVINEHCELLLCCGVERGLPVYSLGKIAEMSLDEIKYNKLNSDYCKECAEIGLSYFGQAILDKKVFYNMEQ